MNQPNGSFDKGSITPRTDALERSNLDSTDYRAWRSLAVQLERELVEARAALTAAVALAEDYKALPSAIVPTDELRRMRDRIERLRGLCKTAVGMLRDEDAYKEADEIAALIGDMEPPLSAPGTTEQPELLPGFRDVMAFLNERFLTSKPAAEILGELEFHIGQTLKVRTPDAYRVSSPPSTGKLPHDDLLGKWNALTLALGDELSESNRVWKLVHAVADVIVEERNAARASLNAGVAPKITTMPLIKRLREQRDRLADLIRECLEGVVGDCTDWNRRAREALKDVPTAEQQLRNIAEGVGMTYEELLAAFGSSTVAKS